MGIARYWMRLDARVWPGPPPQVRRRIRPADKGPMLSSFFFLFSPVFRVISWLTPRQQQSPTHHRDASFITDESMTQHHLSDLSETEPTC